MKAAIRTWRDEIKSGKKDAKKTCIRFFSANGRSQ